ncbi:MAG: hypothetical protein U0838_10395 [Chloroflexota bacterium]
MLLLDEPLGALDLELRKQMQLELKALQQGGGDPVHLRVTHDPEEALTMSDVIVMNRGQIQQRGKPAEAPRARR